MLATASNDGVRELQKNNWVVACPAEVNQSDICFEADFGRGLLINGKNYTDSVEIMGLMSDGNRSFAQILPEEKRGPIRALFKKEFNYQDDTDLERDYAALLRHYWQGIYYTFNSCINAAIDNAGQMSKDPEVIINLQRDSAGVFYLEIELKFKYMNTPRPNNPTVPVLIDIPGRITSRFDLTDAGFQLKYVEPSNTLLRDLIVNKNMEITEQRIKQARREELRTYKADEEVIEIGPLPSSAPRRAKNPRNFFQRNWKAILLGALVAAVLVGIVAALVISGVFTFGVVPAVAAAIVGTGISAGVANGLTIAGFTLAGALMGAGIGAGVSAVDDAIHSQKPVANARPRPVLLLEDEEPKLSMNGSTKQLLTHSRSGTNILLPVPQGLPLPTSGSPVVERKHSGNGDVNFIRQTQSQNQGSVHQETTRGLRV